MFQTGFPSIIRSSKLYIQRQAFVILSTFADDTAIFTTHPDPTLASANLQDHLRSIENWTGKWRLKINKTKSSHITFTLRRGHCPPVYINQTVVPHAETVNALTPNDI